RDLRAEIGEKPSAIGAADVRAQLEHAQGLFLAHAYSSPLRINTPPLIPRLFEPPRRRPRQRVGSRQSRRDARFAPPSASPRPLRSFLASSNQHAAAHVYASARVNRAATRAQHLPRLR